MADLKLDKKEFEKIVGKIKDLDIFNQMGVPIESVTSKEIELEISPNRPDLLSLRGVARLYNSYTKNKHSKYIVNKPEKDYIIKIDKSVDKVRPYTTCAIIKDLKFDDEKIKEVMDIQEKLHATIGRNRKKLAIGIYPLEKIKLPITFRAEFPNKIKFTPLESKKEMTGIQILKDHPKGKEYAHLIEGLKKYAIFEDSNKEILSLTPIINSNLTGKVTEKTKDIFIECSGFDLNDLNQALNILVTAFADMGGKIYSMHLNYPNKKIITPDLKSQTMRISTDHVNKLLGLKLKESEIKKFLEKMGHEYHKGFVKIPAYRTDILNEVDLIEDIAIGYGYENFEPELPNISTIGEESQFEIFKSRIADILVGLGLLEVSTYFITDKNIDKKMNTNFEYIEIENSQSKEHNALRPWLIPNLIQVLSENKHYEYPQNIFEIGKVFIKDKEPTRIAIALCHSKANFTEIKQILDSLFNSLGINYEIRDITHPSLIKGRTGRVSYKNKDIAYIGEVHPSVLYNFGIEYPISVLELNLSILFKLI